jgi:PncC family amidohydrolase
VTGAAEADELAPLVGAAEHAGSLLRQRGQTLATAESCTGGLIGHLLTEIPGSSDYYQGGLISYSDALKQSELGVETDTLASHGAVSAQTCIAMAEGARKRYGSDIAIAVTGIAGPTGDSPGKPLGLTYVAVADAAGHEVERHQWFGDRHRNKVASAAAALTLLVERLEK